MVLTLEEYNRVVIAGINRSSCSVLPKIRRQTPEICLASVKKFPETIKIAKFQNPEICLAAVTRDGNLLEFVTNQTDEICLAAVKSRGLALQFVKNKTHEICLAAVKKNGLALRFVIDQTEEICSEAVKNTTNAVYYIRSKNLIEGEEGVSGGETGPVTVVTKKSDKSGFISLVQKEIVPAVISFFTPSAFETKK